MQHFNYKNNSLFAESVSIKSLAKEYQTPLYVYSQTTIKNNFLEFINSFKKNKHLICYAVKANSNLAILNTLANMGAGFDVVSIGELKRVIVAGGDTKKCVFSGVAKTANEIKFALDKEIYCFNVESQMELELISQVAKDNNKIAPISIRVNPNVDAKTHPYISTGLSENKFGIDILDSLELYRFADSNENLKVLGIDCHIGSQITEIQPFLDTLDKVLELLTKLKIENITISHLDLGGGIGINYDNNKTIDIQSYISLIEEKTNLKIILEPGRAIVGNAGVFISKVEFIKQNGKKNFAIIDGGMNDLLRPSLYQAYHNILPAEKNNNKTIHYDIVGPICETGDFLGKDRELSLQAGDFICVMSAGAYGSVMSSNYNTRSLVAEVIVKGDKHKLIRKRQNIEKIFELEEKYAIN